MNALAPLDEPVDDTDAELAAIVLGLVVLLAITCRARSIRVASRPSS